MTTTVFTGAPANTCVTARLPPSSVIIAIKIATNNHNHLLHHHNVRDTGANIGMIGALIYGDGGDEVDDKGDYVDDEGDDDDGDDNDVVFNLFFFYGKGGRCSSHCPGSSMGCAPR